MAHTTTHSNTTIGIVALIVADLKRNVLAQDPAKNLIRLAHEPSH